MLGHTKKRHTKVAEARFRGTPEAIRRLREIARECNVTDVTEAPKKEGNWTIEEAFPEAAWNKSGIAIRGYRYRENLTQKQLSEMTGIPQRHISEMESGKRAVGKERAKKLAKALNADYRAFL